MFCEHGHVRRAWTLAPLPPHPRPRTYRILMQAMAAWVEDQTVEVDALKIQASSLGAITVKAITGGGKH